MAFGAPFAKRVHASIIRIAAVSQPPDFWAFSPRVAKRVWRKRRPNQHPLKRLDCVPKPELNETIRAAEDGVKYKTGSKATQPAWAT